MAISALQETDGEKDFTCPLFPIKRSTQTVSRHCQPPYFQPCFWSCLKGPGLQSWAWLCSGWEQTAGFAVKLFPPSEGSSMVLIFLQGRNFKSRVKSNASFILPCFISESDMKVTRWARLQTKRHQLQALQIFPSCCHADALETQFLKTRLRSIGLIFPPEKGTSPHGFLGWRSKASFRVFSWKFLLTHSLPWSSYFTE